MQDYALHLWLLLQVCTILEHACWPQLAKNGADVAPVSSKAGRHEPVCHLFNAAATVMCCVLPCGGNLGSGAPAHCPRWAWPSSKRHPFCPGHTWASCMHGQVQQAVACWLFPAPAPALDRISTPAAIACSTAAGCCFNTYRCCCCSSSTNSSSSSKPLMLLPQATDAAQPGTCHWVRPQTAQYS